MDGKCKQTNFRKPSSSQFDFLVYVVIFDKTVPLDQGVYFILIECMHSFTLLPHREGHYLPQFVLQHPLLRASHLQANSLLRGWRECLPAIAPELIVLAYFKEAEKQRGVPVDFENRFNVAGGLLGVLSMLHTCLNSGQQFIDYNEVSRHTSCQDLSPCLFINDQRQIVQASANLPSKVEKKTPCSTTWYQEILQARLEGDSIMKVKCK